MWGTSNLGMVEVALEKLPPGQACDMWLKIDTVKLHVVITWVNDAKYKAQLDSARAKQDYRREHQPVRDLIIGVNSTNLTKSKHTLSCYLRHCACELCLCELVRFVLTRIFSLLILLLLSKKK